MSKGLIDRVLDQIFDAEWTGKRGEKLTERELKWVQLFGRKGKTLRNVYLPRGNGETSEVDVIFISQKGIFVFESKNYSGWIFGDEKSQYWTVSLPNGQKNRFYNPIRQNRTHLKWMREYVGEAVPLFSIVVFSERCELKKIRLESEDVRVIKRDKTYVTVRDIWEHNPDAVSEEQITELYEKLKVLTNVDKAVKAAHVESIQRRFEKKPAGRAEKPAPAENAAPVVSVKPAEPEEPAEPTEQTAPAESSEPAEPKAAPEPDAAAEELLCPRCGAKLILRTAKRGANAGNQFYGCSGYPKCRYVQNL